MTIQTLVSLLQKFEPEAEVFVIDADGDQVGLDGSCTVEFDERGVAYRVVLR